MPGGTAARRYPPPDSVTAVCAPIMDGLVAVTVTPGSTPPLASLTLPLIEPVVLAPPPCANADDAIRHAAITATISWNPRRLMNALLLHLDATLVTRKISASRAPGRTNPKSNTGRTLCDF